MKDIIDKKFYEWTEGKDAKAARINIFNNIRDIPYSVTLNSQNPEDASREMLQQNAGFCEPKHYLLGILFNKLGIDVKYFSYTFEWKNMEINYSIELKELAEKLPLNYHFACKAFIEDKWILVDATWDIGLQKFGFIVNENWDGVSETKNAVEPLKEISHENVSERSAMIIDVFERSTFSEKRDFQKFVVELNKWLAMNRVK